MKGESLEVYTRERKFGDGGCPSYWVLRKAFKKMHEAYVERVKSKEEV